MLRKVKEMRKKYRNSIKSNQDTPVTTGWLFHSPSIGVSTNIVIAVTFAIIFGTLIMMLMLLQDIFDSIIFYIVLATVIISAVVVFIMIYSSSRKDAQTKWENNYSTRILLSVESVKERAEAALKHANISYSTMPNPDTTGYCSGSAYVIWIRYGLGIWIQKIAPWNLTRIIIGPKTEYNTDVVEAARRTLSKEFSISLQPR